MPENSLTVFFHLYILSTDIMNQLHISLFSLFFFLWKGKRDVLINKEVADSCMKDSCPGSTPKSVPGKFYDYIQLKKYILFIYIFILFLFIWHPAQYESHRWVDKY